MLCDRVLKILENNHLTKSACAQELGITHKTFGGYLKPDGQHNLWQYLPTFLAWYPRLSRQWLYFGEGPMFIGQGVPIDAPLSLQELTRAAEAIAEDCGGAWGDVLKLVIGRAQEEAEQQGRTPPKQPWSLLRPEERSFACIKSWKDYKARLSAYRKSC